MTDNLTQIQALRSHYATSLKKFTVSSRTFEILHTVQDGENQPQTSNLAPSTSAATTLFVLDSSFNPPTLAHLRMAISAIIGSLNTSCLSLSPSLQHSRLLLLLATQNADKPSKPALFEDRLVMMTLLAHDLRRHLETSSYSHSSPFSNSSFQETEDQDQDQKIKNKHAPTSTTITAINLPIDIGVTTQPYFIDKAAAIEQSGAYLTTPEQVHLTGYDTLIRIFNPKYYPPEHTLQPLEPFLTQHRLRVTMRPDDECGIEDQERYLLDLAKGGREKDGAKREWAERIQLVEERGAAVDVVSSTRARETASRGMAEELQLLVPKNVADYALSRELYRKDEI